MMHAEALDLSVFRACDWQMMPRETAGNIYEAALAFGNMRLAQREDAWEGWGRVLAYIRNKGRVHPQ